MDDYADLLAGQQYRHRLYG